MPHTPDRRRRRSRDVSEALRNQLDACREDAALEAMVLADEDGLCLAAAGPGQTCGELAATVPLLGRKAGDFQGVLLSDRGGKQMMVQRFRIDASELYLCAIGGDDDQRARQIARSMCGVSRILRAA
jgi:hypothetical protein